MYPVLISFMLGLILLSATHTSLLLLISAIFIGVGYGTIIPSAQAIAIQQSPVKKLDSRLLLSICLQISALV